MSQKDADDLLNKFHGAASTADGVTYFNCFATKQKQPSYFIGTDATERWMVEEFKSYVMPYFSKGIGWIYKPVTRNISYSNDEQIAWFDEILDNERFGTARGSGVLVKEVDDLVLNSTSWKIAQYHLTIPIPNEKTDQCIEIIRQTDLKQN
jgi:SnoaL-like domain